MQQGDGGLVGKKMVSVVAESKVGGIFERYGMVLLPLCLIFLVIIIYSPALNGPFVFDDIRNIKENVHSQVKNFSSAALKEAAFDSPLRSRPLANLTFALNYYFHGAQTFGFHLVNLFIHLAAGLFFFLFALDTLALPAVGVEPGQRRWIALLALFIWLVHPVQIQSVSYIVQRMNIGYIEALSLTRNGSDPFE